MSVDSFFKLFSFIEGCDWHNSFFLIMKSDNRHVVGVILSWADNIVAKGNASFI